MNNCSPNKLQYKEPESPPPLLLSLTIFHTHDHSAQSPATFPSAASQSCQHDRHHSTADMMSEEPCGEEARRTDAGSYRFCLSVCLFVCASLFVFISHSDSTTRKQAERLKRFPQKPPNKNMSASVKNKS